MTPAIDLVKKYSIAHIIHEYHHDPASNSYGREAIEKMAVCEAQVFKTLVIDQGNQKLAVAVIPALTMLSLKMSAKSLGCKKVLMADSAVVQRSTGYVLGGVSPLGQKRLLPTLVDQSATHFDTIYVSAGRRGLEIELNPHDLVNLLKANFVDIAEVNN